MSVWGTDCPSATSAAGPTAITFTYGRIVRSEPTSEYIEHKDEISCVRELIPRGAHWAVEIEYNLWKHTTSPTPLEWYNILTALIGAQDFALKLHDNGDTIKHSTGVAATFCLKSVTPSWVDTVLYRDVLTILFESVDTVILEMT